MFVDRNKSGRIFALYANPQRDGHEWVEGAALEQDPIEEIESKKAVVRSVRKQILDILTGICLAAQLEGDNDTTGAYLVVLQGLKNITDDWPTDPDLVDGVVMKRYQALRAKCTPQMESAFAQVVV